MACSRRQRPAEAASPSYGKQSFDCVALPAPPCPPGWPPLLRARIRSRGPASGAGRAGNSLRAGGGAPPRIAPKTGYREGGTPYDRRRMSGCRGAPYSSDVYQEFSRRFRLRAGRDGGWPSPKRRQSRFRARAFLARCAGDCHRFPGRTSRLRGARLSASPLGRQFVAANPL